MLTEGLNQIRGLTDNLRVPKIPIPADWNALEGLPGQVAYCVTCHVALSSGRPIVAQAIACLGNRRNLAGGGCNLMGISAAVQAPTSQRGPST